MSREALITQPPKTSETQGHLPLKSLLCFVSSLGWPLGWAVMKSSQGARGLKE